MEKTEWLIDKLKRQHDAAAGPAAMLATLQLLQTNLAAELTYLQAKPGKISVLLPVPQWNMNADSELDAYEAETLRSNDEQKVVFELDPYVEENEPEEELVQPALIAQVPPPEIYVAPLPEKKTEPYIYVAPVNPPKPEPLAVAPSVQAVEMKSPVIETDKKSLNDLLEKPVAEIYTRLHEPVKDIKKGISINDHYQYINNLFKGDEATYDRSVKTINNFSIFSEAEFWVRRELAAKFAWEEKDPLVQQFYQLVSRRFS